MYVKPEAAITVSELLMTHRSSSGAQKL